MILKGSENLGFLQLDDLNSEFDHYHGSEVVKCLKKHFIGEDFGENISPPHC